MSRRTNTKIAMSLLEVMIGMAVLTLISGGILASLLQSRRLTEGSIFQNTAVTAAQGYVEQLKNMEFADLDLNPIPTLLEQGVPDSLTVSPLPRSPGTQVVNQKLLDLKHTVGNTNDDMPLNVVVYVEDLGNPGTGIGPSKLITLIYTWEFRDGGGGTRSFTNTVAAIRSQVPTF